MLKMHYIEYIDLSQVLRFVSGDDLCLGPNTVSLQFCKSNYIRLLIKNQI